MNRGMLAAALILTCTASSLSFNYPASAKAASSKAAPDEAASKTDPKVRFGAARSLIEQILKKGQVPSIAVAVAKDGKIIWEEGFGWADRERRVRATAQTPYSLASITKPITATAVMILNEAGHLDLDAPIETYLEGPKLKGYAGSTEGVTARRIMAHSAGLPRYGYFYLDGSEPASSEQTISRYGIVTFPPGTRYEYSNIGMKLLDTAISRISGESYGEYLERYIFLPLGMTRSSLDRDARSAAEAATRYDKKNHPMRFYKSDHPGSGDVWSSAHDMIRFAMFHLGTLLPDQKAILSRGKVMEMQVPTSAPPGPMGLNWVLKDTGGHREVIHYGGQPGVSTMLAFYPEQKLALVVFSNTDAPVPLEDIRSAIVGAVSPELSAKSKSPAVVPPKMPVPAGRWIGTVTHFEGEERFSLDFQPDGDIHVQIADGGASLLNNSAFEAGELTGDFYGKLDTSYGFNRPDLSLKLVRRDDELVGQLVALTHNERSLFMLPSFIRLHREIASNEQ